MAVTRHGRGSIVEWVNAPDGTVAFRLGGAGTTANPGIQPHHRYGGIMVFKVKGAAADTAGGAYSIANPLGRQLIIARVWLHVKTVAGQAGTISIGTAANGTTSSANLIDTLDVASATGIFDNIQDKSTNGKTRQLWSASQFLTGSKATGSLASLVSNLYVEFIDP